MDRAQDGTGLISTGSSVTEGSTTVDASEASGVMLPSFGSFCPNPGQQTTRRPHNASWRRHFILLDGKQFGQLAYSSREGFSRSDHLCRWPKIALCLSN